MSLTQNQGHSQQQPQSSDMKQFLLVVRRAMWMVIRWIDDYCRTHD